MAEISAEQRRRNEVILDHVEQSGDGYMFCVDLEHVEGREARDVLCNSLPDIASALRAVDRASTPLRYMLALVPLDGPVSSVFSHEESLPRAVQMLHEQSCGFGGIWALAIIPLNQKIADMFAQYSQTTGSA